MRIRVATKEDCAKICKALHYKDISFCTADHARNDYLMRRLYCVHEGDKILATFSLVEEDTWDYVAIKRLCILNKKNCGKGIARFIIHELVNLMRGCKIGATPWEDNYTMRYILESEGFKLEYKFSGNWCFYSREV